MNVGVGGGFSTDHHGKCFGQMELQHIRKGGDLTAGLIDLLCCRSVFSLLAGSDPAETPHARAHASKNTP